MAAPKTARRWDVFFIRDFPAPLADDAATATPTMMMVAMTDTPTPDHAPLPADQTAPVAPTPDAADATANESGAKGPTQKPGEIGGPKGPEPTRYGDWEIKGRCSDF